MYRLFTSLLDVFRRDGSKQEPLPWFVWEEVISFLDRQDRWRLLTLNRVWRDRIVTDRLRSVYFKSDPQECMPPAELARCQEVVESVALFSAKNVNLAFFQRSYPKLKHLLLKNFASDSVLINCILHTSFSQCLERLTQLTIDDTVELDVVKRLLVPATNLRQLWLDVATFQGLAEIWDACSFVYLKELVIKVQALDLGFLAMVTERCERLRLIHVNFKQCPAKMAIRRRHLPRGLRTLSLRCPRGVGPIALDLDATKDLRVLGLSFDATFVDGGFGDSTQKLDSLRLKTITAAPALVRHFPNITQLLVNCSECAPGVVAKLVYGLKRIATLKLEKLDEADALFDGDALETVTTLLVQMKGPQARSRSALSLLPFQTCTASRSTYTCWLTRTTSCWPSPCRSCPGCST